ncbi:MAG: class I SAM-dependent methyltransferase [Candidatus Gastranaerophilales bacterium]|nr:class I SAM-dependent methyltransferase [Candidatus Gastranaerophilales bacterium]
MINKYSPNIYKQIYINTGKNQKDESFISSNGQKSAFINQQAVLQKAYYPNNTILFGTYYDFTNRGFDFMRGLKVFPERFLDPNKLKGLKVIDICTGGGRFIYDFIKEGKKTGIDIDITGLDRMINYKYKHQCPEYPSNIVRGDARHTNFLDKTFDIIYSLTGPLSYDGIFVQKEEKEVQLAVITEMNRILKPGGKIRLGMCNLPIIKKLIKDLSDLKITDYNPILDGDEIQKSWLEISKN